MNIVGSAFDRVDSDIIAEGNVCCFDFTNEGNASGFTDSKAQRERFAKPLILHSSSTGKEKDSESDYHYFGARHYDSELLTGWLSVDPMADKYPSLSSYAYCGWNPIKLVDPNGMDTININLDKGIIDLIKADGDHSVRFYKGEHIEDSDVISEDKCRFKTKSSVGPVDGESVTTTYLQCSESSVGEGIFEKITKLGSAVEWDFYSAISDVGELSTSGRDNMMVHQSGLYTSETVDSWSHYHPKNNSDSFYPSYSDQNHARDLGSGVRCTIYHDGKSMVFGRYIKPKGYITISKFRELWNRFAR